MTRTGTYRINQDSLLLTKPTLTELVWSGNFRLLKDDNQFFLLQSLVTLPKLRGIDQISTFPARDSLCLPDTLTPDGNRLSTVFCLGVRTLQFLDVKRLLPLLITPSKKRSWRSTFKSFQLSNYSPNILRFVCLWGRYGTICRRECLDTRLLTHNKTRGFQQH